MRRPAAALGATLSVLAGPATAGAHPIVVPAFVTAGQRENVTFEVPNERQARQTGFSVTVPPELEIVAAGDSDGGWPGTVAARPRAGRVAVSRTARPRASRSSSGRRTRPGDVHVEVRQLYPDGQRVRWPLPLTVLPGAKESGSALTVLLVGGLGLVVTVGLVVLLSAPRGSPGRETA